eukprot:s4273_g7.t1
MSGVKLIIANSDRTFLFVHVCVRSSLVSIACEVVQNVSTKFSDGNYFTFFVVFLLLVTAVGTSLFEAAARFAQAPLQVWWLLAEQLPHATTFYLRYAVLLWGTPFVDLIRCLICMCESRQLWEAHPTAPRIATRLLQGCKADLDTLREKLGGGIGVVHSQSSHKAVLHSVFVPEAWTTNSR